MARPNVTVIINDESFFVPGTESGASLRAGMPSFNDLIGAVGYTAERKSGMMQVDNLLEWISRLKSNDPVGSGASADAFNEGSAGGTFARWAAGPTGDWENEWWAAHNYLQYGGVLIVGSTGEETAHTAITALKDSQLPLDIVFAATGGDEVSSIAGIATSRGDCIAVVSASGGSATDAVKYGSTDDEFCFSVFGQKRHLNIFRNLDNSADSTNDYIITNCAADAAGCIARSDKLKDPWWSPAGFSRGQILDVIGLVENPTNSEMDGMYDDDINPVVTFPGEGTVLFGDKTGAGATSSLSRINVSRLFIYLKKRVGAAARSKLFEFNDAQTRASFVNAVDPMLRNIQNRRGVYDYKVVCDESNNTASMIDSNQFIADIYIKPTKSINFIRITFTNKNTADPLG
jgi:phage tail sheath protein FI